MKLTRDLNMTETENTMEWVKSGHSFVPYYYLMYKLTKGYKISRENRNIIK